MENNKNPLNPRKIALFVVYSLIAVCLLITVLSFNDLPAIFEQLRNANFIWVLPAVLTVLIYLALYPLSLCILTRARGCKIKMSTTYSIAMTEHFFNGITPLATGGQPFQAHSFSRAKVKLSESTSLLLMNFLIYMIVTTGFSFTGLFFFRTLTSEIDFWWIPIIIVGYSMNFLVLVITFLLGNSEKVRSALVRFIYFLCKFRIFRWLEPKAESVKEYFEQVQEAFRDLRRKKGAFLLAIATKIAAYAFLYSSSFFILRAMNIAIQPSQLFLAIAGTSFAITAVAFVPTPGASGGVEGSAGQVFKSIIAFICGGTFATIMSVANGVMLIWRLLSYYFVMLISLFFSIGIEIYFAKKAKKN